jgi:hypothetical protein
MPTFLHLLKGDSSPVARSAIEAQRREPGARVSVVLLDGAPPAPFPSDVSVRRLGDGDLDYSGLLDLIFAADHVVTW